MHPNYFAPYFGDFPPLMVLGLVAALAIVTLTYLNRQMDFVFAGRATARGLGLAAAAATFFGLIIIATDCFVFRFPADQNVPVPAALYFYPAMGFTVDVVLRALPIAALLNFGAGLPSSRREKVLLAGILLAALTEPAIQINAELQDGTTTARAAFVGVHVFAFTLVEFYLFRRYGFVSMVSFRMIYYLYWHILWGAVRLVLLF
jgi:hypothetical protein